MDLGLGNTLLAGDPRLVDHIVGEVKSQGIFDQFRKDCIADVDTKPAYQNLRTRVESSVNSFLSKQTWKADLNKNQLRETLRKHIHDAPYLDAGVERIVDQVVNPKVYSVFMPQIEDVVYKFLGLERPKSQHRNGPCGFKDLLPKDLDPVSPESDKNSLRDVSLDSVDANIVDSSATQKDITSIEKNSKDDSVNDKDGAKNGQHPNEEEKSMDETSKPSSNLPSSGIFNNLANLEDKIEEEEEDSPMFEPIDIMNLHESNMSNDSHLSGISELTSHRSQSPDFSNETSRDNMDFSNHDSQFSKVSSDSRLSIVTDFGSSNHEASTPLSDSLKEDSNKDKNDAKSVKDDFKAVREYETGKVNKDAKLSYEISQTKENTPSDSRAIKRNLPLKETSRDGVESSTKDSRDFKDKTRENESSRSKTTKDRDSKDSKRDKEIRKKQNNHSSDSKNDKSSKTKVKEKSESSRESGEKIKEKDSSGSRSKEEKIKEIDKKDMIKEVKDLKDIYKEKIRELREKKELTEKEKLSKDKDTKLCKETKERRDSSRDKRDSKDHKSSSSSSRGHSSSRNESKTGKSGEKEAKGTRNESRDKGKKDERRYSKDHKSKRNSAGSTDLGEKNDGKRLSRSEKDEKNEKNERSEVKQDCKQKTLSKRDSRGDTSSKNTDAKRESSKSEIDAKDKKRRDEKKNKIKDDHSSLRKNSDDRRSTDRDGSNGSNGKSSQKNNSSSSTSSTKPATTNLTKESTTTSTSSSETSDSIEEKQNEKLSISIEQKNLEIIKTDDNNLNEDETHVKKLDIGQNEISLPIKKRPLAMETDVLLKKPKFAKNFQEAKKLMKIRRRMERENMKKQLDNETNDEFDTNEEMTMSKVTQSDVKSVPDDERVQIVEFRDEEYDEPYPEVKNDFTIEERSQIILGGESIIPSDVAINQFNAKSTLSEMEIAIRESLNEMISDKKIEETNETPKNPQNSLNSEMKIDANYNEESSRLSQIVQKDSSMDKNNSENLKLKVEISSIELKVSKMYQSRAEIGKTDKKYFENENSTKNDEIGFKAEGDVEELTKNLEINNFVKICKSDKSLKEENVETDEKMIFVSNESAISSIIQTDRVDTKDEQIAPIISTKVETRIKNEMTEEEKMNEETIFDKESCNIADIECKKRILSIEKDLDFSDEESPCFYFIENNERLEKFTEFMNSLEIEEFSNDEQHVEISNDELVSSVSKSMAPPKPKRKYSTSPLTDLLLNNANNNNEAHKIIPSDREDNANNMKKRKIGRPKKQERINASLCSQQNLSNGENFVMPLSPESDVSATSEKIPSNLLKDEKSRPRGSNQRYTSDDLYKPRPLFSSSSRRSRRSNQA